MPPPERRLYVGLMSGTSMDGIDAALVELGARRCEVRAARTTPYDPDLRRDLLAASRDPLRCDVDTVGELDHRVGLAFRDAALELLRDNGTRPTEVTAIGSHGQTLRHRPRAPRPFTLQIGDPNLIAAGTGIVTVADLRRRDVAVGGEGAPLAPAFHDWLFRTPGEARVVLNLGGIANITVLPADNTPASGFDTGPASTLMDAWCQQRTGEPYDRDGAWAASGTVRADLLGRMLRDDYFAAAPPKSTGFEYFNAEWLSRHQSGAGALADADLQATLCELTVSSVAQAIAEYAGDTRRVLVCGGGVHNAFLVTRLRETLAPIAVESTAEHGLDPDWVEAAAFAWLAACRLAGQPGNLCTVTGASEAAVLGGVYAGRS